MQGGAPVVYRYMRCIYRIIRYASGRVMCARRKVSSLALAVAAFRFE